MKKGQGWAGAGAAQWRATATRRRRRSAALLQPHAGRPAQSGRGHPTKGIVTLSLLWSRTRVARVGHVRKGRASPPPHGSRQASICTFRASWKDERVETPRPAGSRQGPSLQEHQAKGAVERSPPRRRVSTGGSPRRGHGDDATWAEQPWPPRSIDMTGRISGLREGSPGIPNPPSRLGSPPLKI